MDGKGVGKGIVSGANVLYTVGLAFLGLAVMFMFGFILVGSLTYQVEEGNIPVSNQTNTSVQSVEDDFESVRSSASDAQTAIIGFIVLAVIIMIIVGIGILKMGGKGKSGVDF